MLWAQNARLLCSQNQNGLQNWGIFNRCFGDFTTDVDNRYIPSKYGFRLIVIKP
jgi:hypothetical protein